MPTSFPSSSITHVATLNSTGTPALYLHPVDALHGDLGVVRKEDVVICISKKWEYD